MSKSVAIFSLFLSLLISGSVWAIADDLTGKQLDAVMGGVKASKDAETARSEQIRNAKKITREEVKLAETGREVTLANRHLDETEKVLEAARSANDTKKIAQYEKLVEEATAGLKGKLLKLYDLQVQMRSQDAGTAKPVEQPRIQVEGDAQYDFKARQNRLYQYENDMIVTQENAIANGTTDNKIKAVDAREKYFRAIEEFKSDLKTGKLIEPKSIPNNRPKAKISSGRLTAILFVGLGVMDATLAANHKMLSDDKKTSQGGRHDPTIPKVKTQANPPNVPRPPSDNAR